jgi:hypothetical protein
MTRSEWDRIYNSPVEPRKVEVDPIHNMPLDQALRRYRATGYDSRLRSTMLVKIRRAEHSDPSQVRALRRQIADAGL